jgi:L-asparaginase
MAEENGRAVTVLAAGGTIAMRAESGSGATPALDADALTSGLGVSARSVRRLPGAQLGLDDALAIAREAADEAGSNRGVVVTSGTDTLEELAVLTDALHAGDTPIVFTGAIRPASSAGADGPANLIDAVAVARAAPGGVYVVFGGEVHAAREARKRDSTSPAAFASPRTGPLGYVAEGRVSLHARAPRPVVLSPTTLGFRVPVVATFLGDDGSFLPADVDGLVLVALGAGHVPPPVLDALSAVNVPVVACVRPERGALLHETYGFRGAEGDLRAAGVIPAATASPQAARMRLLAALGAGADPRSALSDLA